MRRTMMKSKIHRATVTGSDLDYVGSITLDPALMHLADVLVALAARVGRTRLIDNVGLVVDGDRARARE